MHSNDPTRPDDGGAPAASPLPALLESGGRVEAEKRRLLDLSLEALAWGKVQAEVGLTLQDYLTCEAGLDHWTAVSLVSVAERLPALPEVADRYRAEVIGFEQLVEFVRVTRELNGERLAVMDEEAASLADALHEQHRIPSWTSEIAILVEDLRAPGHLQRIERRRERDLELSAQQDFDGGGLLWVNADKINYTKLMTAIDDARDPDEPSLRRSRALGLVRMCDQWMASTPGHGNRDGNSSGRSASRSKPARPTLIAHLDLADATPNRFAQLSRLSGLDQLVPLSDRLTGLLGQHADLVVQLQDGARPLAELIAKNTDDIPAPIRRMIRRRDRGCRWPGCNRPMRLIQVHHIVHLEDGGTHDPDNLLCLCAFHHLRYVHKLGWKPTIDLDTGRVTWHRRGNRPRASMPHGARPPPRRDPALLPDWQAPPRSPPPCTADPPESDRVPAHWTLPPSDLDTALPSGSDPPDD